MRRLLSIKLRVRMDRRSLKREVSANIDRCVGIYAVMIDQGVDGFFKLPGSSIGIGERLR